MNPLTKTFPDEQCATVLASWSWAGIDGMRPRVGSLFGDLILEDHRGVWFLDIVAGTVTREWGTWPEAEQALAGSEGQQRWLLGALAHEAQVAGLGLNESQIYDFKVPPALSGPLVVENLAPADFVVAADIAGQIHRQIKDLLPGTVVSGMTLQVPPERGSVRPQPPEDRKRRWGRR